MLKRNDPTSLYIQLADDIREKILDGSIRPGDRLPSEAKMIATYGVGRLTVRSALKLLVEEGLLEKAQGKGTFCRETSTDQCPRVQVILDMENGYFISYFVRGISEILQTNNYDFLISNSNYSVENVCHLLTLILDENPAGVILELSPAHIPQELADKLRACFRAFRERHIPVLTIDSTFPSADVSYTMLDEIAGGARAAEHLAAYGHTRSAVVYRPDHWDSVERYNGFCRAAEKFGMEAPTAISTDDGMEARLLDAILHDGVTGVFSYNDAVAVRCIRCLKSNGINVPGDVSVIGFDDSYLADPSDPPLTTISHPKEKMGRHAASAILSLIRHETEWPYQEVFEPRLVERSSCARCKTE